MISQGDLLELGLPQKVMHMVRREVEQPKDAEFATKVCKEAIIWASRRFEHNKILECPNFSIKT